MDDFLIVYPVWVLIDAATAEANAASVKLYTDSKTGRHMLPVYTDNDLGRRAIAEQRMQDTVLLGMATPAAFRTLLLQVLGLGVEHVGFDVALGPPTRGVFRSVRSLLGRLEAGDQATRDNPQPE